MVRKLTTFEREVCEALARGDIAKGDGEDRISAQLVRDLVYGLCIDRGDGSKPEPILCPAGLRITGAIIEGRIDIAHAGTGAIGPMAIALTDCELHGGLDADHAIIASLSLHGSRCKCDGVIDEGQLATISLVDAHVQGEIDLRALSPASQKGYANLSAHGAQIDGTIEFTGANLKCPPVAENRRLDRSDLAALDLSVARIDGDVMAMGGTWVEGIVRMRSAVITGDLWLCGSTFRPAELPDADEKKRKGPAQPRDVLFLPGLKVEGSASIAGWADNRDGTGRFRPAEIAGNVQMLGAHVAKMLYVAAAKIRGNFQLAHAEIGGDFSLVRGRFSDAKVLGWVNATSARIDGSANLGIGIAQSLFLKNAQIGGSLDISELRIKPANPANWLIAAGARIGRALKLVEENSEKTLLAVRAQTLSSLPDSTLVETLWRQQSGGRVQIGFLLTGNTIMRLNGQSERLEGLIARRGHSVDSLETAHEYLRLFCSYLEGEDGSFRLLPDPSTRPPGLVIDREKMEEAIRLWRISNEDLTENDVARCRTALNSDTFDAWAQDNIALSVKEAGDRVYLADAIVLYSCRLFNAHFRIDASDPAQIHVAMLQDEWTGMLVGGVPQFVGGFTYPPFDGVTPLDGEKVSTRGDGFLTAPTLDAMQAVESEPYRDRLRPYVQSSIELFGVVDLSDATCETLEDYGGFAWGNDVALKLNHFAFGRTDWDRSRFSISGSKTDRVRRWAKAQIWEFAPARFLNWLTASGINLDDRARSAWRTRRDWIRLQYRTRLGSGFHASNVRPDKDVYRPQPLEHIIKVARAEGQEDYATRFEIEKRQIEARIHARQTRALGIAVGVLAMLLTMIAAPFPIWGRILTGLGALAGCTFGLEIGDRAMRWGFGYLLRPFRAIVTLVFLFLIGWGGVHLANTQRMLVIDVAPVADVVRADGNTVLIGSAAGVDVVGNVHCANEITEALYALDVLIPLIDLRQESECEVGYAEIPMIEPAAAPPDRTALWDFLKAVYGITGWIVVSLVILTFVNAFRTKREG
jgi:hypothetical protein